MNLYGRNWTRRELEAYIGRIEPIGGVKRFRISEGPASGVEMIQVRTGAGLTYYLNSTRALDISLAEFCSVPLSWHAINEEIHPAYFDGRSIEWLRTAVGGLLMTCGLTQVGSPCDDAGESLGLHGRVHHIPARQVVAEGNWEGDEYTIRVRGIVEETRIFGEHIRMTREITTRIGDNKIIINDLVENTGFQSTPHMILYHFNFGFPLLSKDTEIKFPSKKIIPREKDVSMENYNRWQPPDVGFQERVYYHEELEVSSSEGKKRKMASVFIRNPQFPGIFNNKAIPISVRLSWDTSTLPKLVQWKMPGAGTYVLGVEPANCYVEGRVKERERGTLVMLEPGNTKSYFLEVEILSG